MPPPDWQTPKVTSPRKARAFTLIEMLVVVILLGFLSIAAVPAMSVTQSVRRRGAAQQMLRDLTFARQRAQATAITSWVRFDPANSAYSVLSESAPGAGRATALTINDPAINAPMAIRYNTSAFNGVTFQVNRLNGDEVGFDRYGRPLLITASVMTANVNIAFGAGVSVNITARTGLVWASFP